jgi:hypothetical protein
MDRKTINRLIRAVAAAIALGLAAWSYVHSGLTTETSLFGVFGLLFGVQAATGAG